jgi:hypothetical protein
MVYSLGRYAYYDYAAIATLLAQYALEHEIRQAAGQSHGGLIVKAKTVAKTL